MPPEPIASTPPSDWVVRWTPLLPPSARVLDVACGHGRHARWLAQAGHQVTAIDHDAASLAPLASFARTHVADLEADAWPLPEEVFDAVLVTNYLWRPLFPALLAAVAPGGLLIYETFALAHAALGRPRRAEFLLRPGELIERLRGPPDDAKPFDDRAPPASAAGAAAWHVIAFEEGRLPARGDVPEREVQRIVARRGHSPSRPVDRLAPAG